MKLLAVSLAILASLTTTVLAAEVKIDVTRAVECDRKSKKGDKIAVHYRGSLEKDGSEFDTSYKRGKPLEFVVGKGSVIKGWDDNLLDMCIGEKRTLTIPPEFGYGDRTMGPIPGGSTLIFETELMGIDGVKAPEKIVEKAAGSPENKAAGAAEKAGSGAKEAVKSVVSEVVDAAKTVLADSDAGAQEHDEL